MICVLTEILKDITLSELRRTLYEVRDAVQYKGEIYRVLYYSHPVAYCVPVGQIQDDWRTEEIAIGTFRNSIKDCCDRLRSQEDSLDGFVLSVFGRKAFAFISIEKYQREERVCN